MSLKEKNIRVYTCATNFLEEILPVGFSENDLNKYFVGDRRDYTSLIDVYEQLIASAQNYQSMPNIINLQDRKEKIKSILFDFDLERIANMDSRDLYYIFRNEFQVTSRDNNHNCWLKWSLSVIDAAKFMREFSNPEDFKNFVSQFDYNLHTRMALPLLISTKIHGIGFALACDFLKELGYLNYPKPDVHLIDVFTKLGLSDNKQTSVFEAIARMAEDCREIDPSITPYKIDKIIWLICSGKFYLDNLSVGQHKDEFIEKFLNQTVSESIINY